MAQILTTNIVINAKTGNGFSQVGSTLTELGTLVNGISQKLIDFGEDSVKVYRDYEKSMKDAEVALSTTYGRNTQQLSNVMTQLDATATEWAATTIFHTNDVANAIAEASHAGWDLNQIMSGLPAAMQLAQAGGLDLSEAVNYIVKSTSAAGIGFENLENFTDLWTFAANSSASTIREFGDAMLRMGSTMHFTGNTEELMTLIAMTANAGSVGSEAGTMIRNSIMRLIAPTQKADKAMNELGATSEETAELLNSEALAAANAELAAHGFSAFDSAGNMKNVLDIYSELYLALGEIAGGYENIEKNESALSILSSIFPTRTITEALTLLRAAANEYDGLYDAMRGGAANGYGAYAADTMMDTLNGRIETFNSKVERLKQLVGAELAPQIGDFLSSAGELVDGISEADPALFSAFVKGFEVIAGAGPGLLIAGGALRLIGSLLTPTGLVGAGLIALAATAVSIHDLQESKFANNFGNMNLDTSAIQDHVRQLGKGFRTAYGEVNKFREYLNEAVSDYEEASSQLSSSLMTKMVTGAQLTEEDKIALQNLGNDVYEALQTAIASSSASEMNYLQTLFGGEGNIEDSPAYQELLGLANSSYEEAMSQAEQISQGIANALTNAFADGEISAEEYQNILSYMRSYNEAIAKAEAEAQNEQSYIDRMRILQKGQTASAEEIYGVSQELTEARDSLLQQSDDQFWNEYYRQQYRGASDAALSALQDQHDAEIAALRAPYDQSLMNLWGTALTTSDQGGNYSTMSDIVSRYMSGELTEQTATKLTEDLLGKSSVYAGTGLIPSRTSDRAQLGRMLGSWVNAMGGDAAVQQMIQSGDANAANMYAMAQLVNGWTTVQGMNGTDLLTSAMIQQGRGQDNRSAAEAVLQGAMSQYSAETARRAIENSGLENYFQAIGNNAASGYGPGVNEAFWRMDSYGRAEASNIVDQLQSAYDFEKVLAGSKSPFAELGNGLRDQFAAFELLYGEASKHAEDFRIEVKPELDTASLKSQMPDSETMTVDPKVNGETIQEQIPDSVKITAQVDVAGGDEIGSISGQTVDVQVGGDTGELAGAISEHDGQEITEIVNGDTFPLAQAIKAQDRRRLTENVGGNISALRSAIDSQDGRHITVYVDEVSSGGGFSHVSGKFASGGRATTASIFGEAGPEWAIPEEHTQRTAELLNATREASGFTWGELLSHFGGLNANPNNKPTTIVYSPTIHAQDARGVEAALREDKKRLERWFKEKQLLDSVEVYT